ncbi:acetate/propionate family kinase [Petrotoga sp. 9PWA.NaAc.5.4]|uniref:acetate/propionate family kinase n=1 Tax=Petrotoga sp. 9PWA.NaAc.5.4 TaxID=1434328 RepID=UPI000CB76A34|nr:acetate kinase [Petrotoga sp. 9PWA.NaAc.5.4]PNR92306.1 acetate kinase [Petrotoga sp. 9PWA.NaAc.5.4]
MKILVINSGSSSLKYQVLDMKTEECLVKGIVERIGEDQSDIKHKNKEKICENDKKIKDHEEALKEVMKLLIDPEYGCLKELSEIDAIGHRVVHGGEKFFSSVLINDEVIEAIEENSDLAPLHNPPNLTGIRAAKKLLPGVPQVAVFDTSFHHTMEPKAYMYGLAYELYEKYKIRKYGFHGTSHRYVSQKAAEILGKDIESLKIISAHLGNGASLAAVDKGKVIDTSMGFTPLEGLIMGTRSGDIDPSIPLFLLRKGYTIDEVDDILNKKSGLTGLSGISNDMRDIKKAIREGNKKAKLAYDVYVYRLAKYIGSYATILKRFDVLIFTAGVGENNPEIRKDVCDYLDIFELKLDEEKNNILNKEDRIISTSDSHVKVLVIKTDEELMIAKDTKKIVEKMGKN